MIPVKNKNFDWNIHSPSKPGLEVIKLFSSSAQLSMKFQLLINAEIVKISEKFRFKPQKLVIYLADKMLKCQQLLAF